MPAQCTCLLCGNALTLPPRHQCTRECHHGIHFDICAKCVTRLIVFWETGHSFKRKEGS